MRLSKSTFVCGTLALVLFALVAIPAGAQLINGTWRTGVGLGFGSTGGGISEAVAQSRAYSEAYAAARAQLESYGTIRPMTLTESGSCGTIQIMGTVTGVICDVTLGAMVIGVE